MKSKQQYKPEESKATKNRTMVATEEPGQQG